ncbi:MAG: hypothetical protein AMS21_06360 [Gemmatimonas sp. SG8_38_2]|nr:MAG: hypothetical protein AMS21_06360 [Gemmatimonas sp. SG8_38_2]
MDWLYLIGRILYGMLFVGSAFGHFMQLKAMSRYAGSKNVPGATVMVLITGLMLLGGGLSIVLGIYMEIGAWLIFFFLVPVALVMHNFWAIPDPMAKMVEQAMFMKNISLGGAALLLYWTVQTCGYGPMTLGNPM